MALPPSIYISTSLLSPGQVLKLYAWESFFKDELSTIRDGELRQLRGIALLGAGTAISFTLLPFLVNIVITKVRYCGFIPCKCCYPLKACDRVVSLLLPGTQVGPTLERHNSHNISMG